MCLMCLFPMKFCIFASMFSTMSLPYSLMSFIGVPVDSGIIMIFAPAYVHPDFFALSIKFSLNRLMDFDYPSKSYGIFRMALLNSFMPVVNL